MTKNILSKFLAAMLLITSMVLAQDEQDVDAIEKARQAKEAAEKAAAEASAATEAAIEAAAQKAAKEAREDAKRKKEEEEARKLAEEGEAGKFWYERSGKAILDAVGGNILSSMLASMKYNGIITACGNVAGANFTTSVFPFILRKNRLIGIDSATCSKPIREKIWNKFSTFWRLKNLDHICKIIDLNSLDEEIKKMLRGEQVGRIVVRL